MASCCLQGKNLAVVPSSQALVFAFIYLFIIYKHHILVKLYTAKQIIFYKIYLFGKPCDRDREGREEERAEEREEKNHFLVHSPMPPVARVGKHQIQQYRTQTVSLT